MKTIIRIGETLEGTSQIQEAKLSAFGVKQLVDAFAKRRSDFSDGLMVVEHAEDKRPVFITLSSRPPELLQGQREVYAVFWPPDSQEPVATFFDEPDAQKWAADKYDDLGKGRDEYIIRPIDSTDKMGVVVSLATMVSRPDGKMLFCRIKGSKEWTLPEGTIGLGESTGAAAVRSVLQTCGVEIENTGIPARIPYMNTYVGMAGQHFLTIVMHGQYKGGNAAALDDTYDRVEWFPAKYPPKPQFGLMAGIVRALEKYEPKEATESVGDYEAAPSS
jgi:ADP-ribose pyrophosphatase YjhB (NUDIX family)